MKNLKLKAKAVLMLEQGVGWGGGGGGWGVGGVSPMNELGLYIKVRKHISFTRVVPCTIFFKFYRTCIEITIMMPPG